MAEMTHQVAEHNFAVYGDNMENGSIGAKSLMDNIGALFNIFGISINYQVGYICVPFKVCHSAGVYYEK